MALYHSETRGGWTLLGTIGNACIYEDQLMSGYENRYFQLPDNWQECYVACNVGSYQYVYHIICSTLIWSSENICNFATGYNSTNTDKTMVVFALTNTNRIFVRVVQKNGSSITSGISFKCVYK